MPYVLTFATPHRSRRVTLGETEIEFRQLKKELFFGYLLDQGLYVAEPEKALLDQMYMVSRGLSDLGLEELDVSSLDRGRLRDCAARFPAAVQAMVQRMMAKNSLPEPV